MACAGERGAAWLPASAIGMRAPPGAGRGRPRGPLPVARLCGCPVVSRRRWGAAAPHDPLRSRAWAPGRGGLNRAARARLPRLHATGGRLLRSLRLLGYAGGGRGGVMPHAPVRVAESGTGAGSHRCGRAPATAPVTAGVGGGLAEWAWCHAPARVAEAGTAAGAPPCGRGPATEQETAGVGSGWPSGGGAPRVRAC